VREDERGERERTRKEREDEKGERGGESRGREIFRKVQGVEKVWNSCERVREGGIHMASLRFCP
jgi:hypothetical protein